MTAPAGWVCEVFASIQGEGLYCGQRQTFVRFAGCNLRCRYCDTPAALDSRPASCRVEQFPGCGVFDQEPNPISADRTVSACVELRSRVVALTGGEPLAQPEFAESVLRSLKSAGMNTYLETNGSLSEELEQIIEVCDTIAMDIKLPSASGCAHWAEHERFLRVASQANVFVKVTVSRDTTDEDVARAAEITAAVDGAISMVIQPVYGVEAPLGPHLMRMQDTAGASLQDVRVIPQCHRMLGLP